MDSLRFTGRATVGAHVEADLAGSPSSFTPVSGRHSLDLMRVPSVARALTGQFDLYFERDGVVVRSELRATRIDANSILKNLTEMMMQSLLEGGAAAGQGRLKSAISLFSKLTFQESLNVLRRFVEIEGAEFGLSTGLAESIQKCIDQTADDYQRITTIARTALSEGIDSDEGAAGDSGLARAASAPTVRALSVSVDGFSPVASPSLSVGIATARGRSTSFEGGVSFVTSEIGRDLAAGGSGEVRAPVPTPAEGPFILSFKIGSRDVRILCRHEKFDGFPAKSAEQRVLLQEKLTSLLKEFFYKDNFAELLSGKHFSVRIDCAFSGLERVALGFGKDVSFAGRITPYLETSFDPEMYNNLRFIELIQDVRSIMGPFEFTIS